ncbi:hypothetical protein Pta6605_29010 [Pseudomonas amygdali pv. tabaci]|nr:hypothetical protein Pta6605_29010 [Pseudomonas amygdali pv. tabaci]
MRRVNRYVARPGLEHGQQADQRLEAASCNHGNTIVGLYADADQVLGERIGMRVQLAVTEALLAHLRGDRVRLLLCQVFDALVNRQPAVIVGLPIIETEQKLRSLAGGHHIKLIDGHLRRLLQRIEHTFHGPLHVSANALRTDTCGSLCSKAKRFAQIVDAQYQRVVAALLSMQHLNALPCFTGSLRW